MKVLVVGGAGYVGSILQPALEAEHECRYLDLKPVPGAADRTIIGDANDSAMVEKALDGMQCVLWLAMGVKAGLSKAMGSADVDAAFDVNVKAMYRMLVAASGAGVRRFVYASSLSVYSTVGRRATFPLDENEQPNAWRAYGASKRLGETLGEMWVQQELSATFLALRLFWPRNDEDWPGNEFHPDRRGHPLGPNDMRRLFLAGIAFSQPGFYAVQSSGDLAGAHLPNTRVTELLGWEPQGN
jgi:nucleoside-diphosphate-sugar epimerase